MSLNQNIIALAVVLFYGQLYLIAAQPQPPKWPSSFSETFVETSTLPVAGTSNNIKGTYYYDYEKKAVRIDRSTGKYDRYCGSVKVLQDTPCTHLVLGDYRYLVFPTLKSCCMCCTAESGCGAVRPDWLSDATFVGYNETAGVKYQVWDKQGLQSNFYWQVDGGNQAPYVIDQVPNDLMVFDVNSYKPGPVDPSVFALPSYCSQTQKCPLFSVCTVAR